MDGVSLSFVGKGDSIALVTLLGDETDPTQTDWGTKLHEHRISPTSIASINSALDKVLANDKCRAVIVTGQGKFFSNGLDLKWIDANPGQGGVLQDLAEALLARVLTFPLPTIACVNGHMTAAGAMFGLAFDVRIMNSEKGFVFIPGIDLGLVYSQGMTELIKSKTPSHMHRDVLAFAKRYTSAELLQERVVDAVAPRQQLLPACIQYIETELFRDSPTRFHGGKYRSTMQAIKKNMYLAAYNALVARKQTDMGFASGSWDAAGKAKL